MDNKLMMSGTLGTKVRRVKRASIGWTLTNILRTRFVWNFITYHLARLFTQMTGIATMRGRLRILHIKANGEKVNYGWAAHGLVTDAFVAFMVDQLQAETSQWGDFKYHDSGIGVTAANNDNTDIETSDEEARATGDQGEGASAWIYKSVGTINYTTTKAITEHGLFSQAAGTTLMDRHVFAAINVVNGDSIEFTYQLTCTAET